MNRRGGALGRVAARAALAALAATGACQRAGASDAPRMAGDVERGKALIQAYGCGACHVVPGVPGADATVGPPLVDWSRRTYIAGKLPNSPPYLMRWIMTPQAVDPGNAMPDMGVGARDAADIAAYLYTIR